MLLKYVVEAYLDGSLDRVKERTIGIEVFHRHPDYDTNHDSVVRTTAAEVRKRLAQYYLEPDHQQELRFLLPQGAYLPEFRWPAPPAPQPIGAEPAIPLPESFQPLAENAAPRRRRVWLAMGLLPLLVTGTWLYSQWRHTELDAFWAPLLTDHGDAVICIGQPLRIYMFDGASVDELNQKMVGTDSTPPPPDSVRESTSVKLSELKSAGNRYFYFGDVMAAVRMAELLARKGKPFQVFGDRIASYYDLRGRPAVLIGQFNNRWTKGLTSGLRYYLSKNAAHHTYEVLDRQNPKTVVASVSQDATRPAEYAIVSRVFDPSTEKTVIAVAGMTYMGTMAAGDFLTNNAYMKLAFQHAPAQWYGKNIQVVIETTLVGGTAGPPKVIATYFW
ncbi:MAG TPA: hypothetical protein VG675_16450 [Bryobacteraceae bacterium]|nr:hypothetical protein [Bryobacteraceae bacterium]